MSKKFQFSTGKSIELASDGLITNSYESKKHMFNKLDIVFIKKPGFLSRGYVNINDEYVSFKKKDMSLVIELIDYLERLGVIAAMYRGKSTERYLESNIAVGGSCSFFTFIGGELIYYYFGDVYKVNYEQIKCIWVSENIVVFGADNDSLLNSVILDKENDIKAETPIRRSDYKSAIDFANNVKNLASHIEIKVIG